MLRACAPQCCWTSSTSRVSWPYSGCSVCSTERTQPAHTIEHGIMQVMQGYPVPHMSCLGFVSIWLCLASSLSSFPV